MSGLKTFLYFAYGSNLLAKRIHINNPSAVRKTIGKLLNYRIDFNYFSQRWKGCAATIVPDEPSHIWGAVWEIDTSHMDRLDRQEGVDKGVYRVVQVKVTTPDGEVLDCRSYELTSLPPKLPENANFPQARCPSKVYLDTIVTGAIESNLPAYYIETLKRFPNNGYDDKVDFNKD